jgi:hypothetical protein
MRIIDFWDNNKTNQDSGFFPIEKNEKPNIILLLDKQLIFTCFFNKDGNNL